MRRSLFAIVTLMGTAFAGQHAPLPPALMQAKTVYIDNQAGRAAFADKCYQELTKWGRFKVVSDPKSADVIFRITSMTRSTGLHGSTSSRTNGTYDSGTYDSTTTGDVNLREAHASFTRIDMVEEKTGQVLWSDTRSWGNLFTGFRSATKAVVKELRKRMEEQEKQDNK